MRHDLNGLLIEWNLRELGPRPAPPHESPPAPRAAKPATPPRQPRQRPARAPAEKVA